MSNLLNQLVRLAHAKPDLRDDLLPLVASSQLSESQLLFLRKAVELFDERDAHERSRWGKGLERGINPEEVAFELADEGVKTSNRTVQALIRGGYLQVVREDDYAKDVTKKRNFGRSRKTVRVEGKRIGVEPTNKGRQVVRG